MTWFGTQPARRARLLRCLCLVAPLLAASCSGGGDAKDAASDGAPKRREPARVRTAAIERREMVRKLTTTTVVESEREIKLFPRTAGVVTDIYVEEGDKVEAGTVLATLDRRHTKGAVDEVRVERIAAENNVRKADIQKSEAEARIAQLQLKWEQASRDFERNDKTKLISQQALDNLRVTRDSAKGDLETSKLASERATIEAKAARTSLDKTGLVLARVQLEDSYMEITAPFSGVIASRSIKIGNSVGPSAPAFVLTDATNLRSVFHRPQRELGLFLRAVPEGGDGKNQNGRALDIRVLPEALPGVVFRVDLWLVSPSIDASSGSFRVTVRLGPVIEGAKESRLLPGMLVRLEIVTERHPDALVVPKRALRREGEQNLLFTVDKGIAHRLEVDEGFSDDESVEIRARASTVLPPGARVVVVGNRELEDGAEVVEDASPADPKPLPPAEIKTTNEGETAPKKG